MDQILDFIKKHKLIKAGQVIGVGVSGGVDSMTLLHFLHENRQVLDIEVVAIHINHGIREESDDEARFVLQKCREMGVRVYKFTIDSPKIAKDKRLSIETAAREGRYGVFDALIRKDIVDRIALAHHQSDQAETILMHIFRGCGVSGARGMEPIRDGYYIRPMLNVSKEDILDYASLHNIDYVEDSSNSDISYTRNYLRHVVMKDILEKWPNAIQAINNFASAVSEDDEYIKTLIETNSLSIDDKTVHMPCSYFYGSSAIYSRIVFQALALIGVKKDIERKHIEMIKNLATNLENGKKIRLPYDIVVSKEYDYLTFENNYVEKPQLSRALKCEEFEAPNFGKVVVKRVKSDAINDENALYFDYRKVPKTARWRYREEGDVFEKFGGGTKKIKSIFIDKKIPVRLRDYIPVLADENEIYVIAGVGISEKVRVDADVPTCLKIIVEK
ncbi:MAG: tRNA lysidine(34) synthetase TilS [Clostridiales bacterium]|nr:tRNA lysidine(34) synthetase TilS [Clostridiales bacterium]